MSTDRDELMPHIIHQPVVAMVQKAIGIMDAFLRDRIDLRTYAETLLKELNADDLLARYRQDFRAQLGIKWVGFHTMSHHVNREARAEETRRRS